MCVVPAWDETRIEPSCATWDTGSPPAWFWLMKVGAPNDSAGGVGAPGQVTGGGGGGGGGCFLADDDVGSRPSAATAATMSRILKPFISHQPPIGVPGAARTGT